MKYLQNIEVVLFVSLVLLFIYFAYTQLLRYWQSEKTISQAILDDLESPYAVTGIQEFRFELRESSLVTFSILNEDESIIKTVLKEDKAAGYHSLNYDFTGLNPGWYWYQLQTPSQNITRKLKVA